jgi:hypothetical protein
MHEDGFCERAPQNPLCKLLYVIRGLIHCGTNSCYGWHRLFSIVASGW